MNDTGLSATGATAPAHRRAGLGALTLGAVGVVYGDIGTSPLYALREALRLAAADGVTRAEVLGVVSLLLWALILIVTLKYVLFLLRADNKGEGGILSMLALAQNAIGRRTGAVFALGIAGAALFFAEAILTPAISVLSAVEGLELITPVFEPYVVPVAVALLVLLFLAQSRGTGAIAAWFGPITALWFLVMAVAGAVHIADDPGVLAAFNPAHGISFLGAHGLVGVLVLGAVFMAVTGAEALYPDLGHFGRRPIQIAWFALVFPALALNYLGQGALVLAGTVRSRGTGQPVLPARARLGAVRPRPARHRGDADRQPGRHYRGIFAGAPSRAARVPAAARGAAHLRKPQRPNLHALRQLAAARGRAGAGPAVPDLERPRLGPWHRRLGHHAD